MTVAMSDWMTVEAAARYIGKSVRGVRWLGQQGRIVVESLGQGRPARVSKHSCDAYREQDDRRKQSLSERSTATQERQWAREERLTKRCEALNLQRWEKLAAGTRTEREFLQLARIQPWIKLDSKGQSLVYEGALLQKPRCLNLLKEVPHPRSLEVVKDAHSGKWKIVESSEPLQNPGVLASPSTDRRYSTASCFEALRSLETLKANLQRDIQEAGGTLADVLQAAGLKSVEEVNASLLEVLEEASVEDSKQDDAQQGSGDALATMGRMMGQAEERVERQREVRNRTCPVHGANGGCVVWADGRGCSSFDDAEHEVT